MSQAQCPNCSVNFKKSRHWQVFCSKHCHDEHHLNLAKLGRELVKKELYATDPKPIQVDLDARLVKNEYSKQDRLEIRERLRKDASDV